MPRGNLPAMPMIGNHEDPRCWYNLVKHECQLDLVNVSYGGFSNEEILDAASQQLALEKFDLVILQLTSTQRRWFYRSADVFSFVLAHGANVDNDNERRILEYVRVNLNNELKEIEKTLSRYLIIQQFLQCQDTPLITINGLVFGDLIQDLKQDAEEFCRPYIDPHLWIKRGRAYAQELARLAHSIDTRNFLGQDRSWAQQQIDFADDGIHPGVLSNQLYARSVADKIQEIC